MQPLWPALLAAVLGCLLLAPAAEARKSCSKTLPARVGLPSSEVEGVQERAYVKVRARKRARLRGIRVRLKDGSSTVARGHLNGRAPRRARVPVEFREQLQPDRNYRIAASGFERGCKGKRKGKRQRVLELVSLSGGDGPPPRPGPGAVVQHLTIDWSGGAWQDRDRADFDLPGIGRGVVVCAPDTQWIRVFPDDPGRETAMVNWTYRTWDDSFSEGAVREAQTTPYTGPDFNEGFNKWNPTPEHRSIGSFTGVISDRLPFGAAGGPGASPTALELSWEWDFSDQASSRCYVAARFTTEGAGSDRPLARSLSVNWRGDGAAVTNGASLVEVPGLGQARVDCQAGPSGIRRLTVFPDPGVEGAEFTTYEGSEAQKSSQSRSPYRLELPNNGFVVADLDGDRGRLFLSSRWKANDPDPGQNFCFLAGIVKGS